MIDALEKAAKLRGGEPTEAHKAKAEFPKHLRVTSHEAEQEIVEKEFASFDYIASPDIQGIENVLDVLKAGPEEAKSKENAGSEKYMKTMKIKKGKS